MESQRIMSDVRVQTLVGATKSLMVNSSYQDGESFAPPQDSPEWGECIHQLADSSGQDVRIMEPNESRPGKSYVDSDDEEIGDELQESVIATDERLHVTPTATLPYKWVCSLRMTFSNGKRYIGTGFFCAITGSKKLSVVTCAHNIWNSKRGGYASYVEIIQGRDGYKSPYGTLKATSSNLRVPEAYKEMPRAAHDYGIIILNKSVPGHATFGFGFRVLGDSELNGRIVQTCGYPGDKPGGTMWLAGGVINRIKPCRIYYSNDTAGGQSGSPVWTWSGWNFMIIGVHGYGLKVRNSARRITDDMVNQVEKWVREF